MLVFPAIDLIGGQVVRLQKGDYNQKTVYGNDPVETALSFFDKGATNLHIVDLDGAKSGMTDHYGVIENIAKNTDLFIEVGGGIRSMDTIERYLEAGVSRVIIGTAAVKNPAFLKEAVGMYGEKIAVGIDVKDELVAINGWLDVTEYSCIDFCKEMEKAGVRTIIVTDISKDGMLEGTNVALYRKIMENCSVKLVASGGVTKLSELEELHAIGVHAVILGKALYTGKMDLEQALIAAKDGGGNKS